MNENENADRQSFLPQPVKERSALAVIRSGQSKDATFLTSVQFVFKDWKFTAVKSHTYVPE